MGAVRYLTLLPVLDGFRTDAGAAILAVPLMGLGAALGWVFPLFPNAGQSTLFGSARWASKKEADALTRNNGGLLVGRQQGGSKPIRYDGISHLITLAPTRTGKGVGTVIPNLLDADRSVLCIDPKGENARITMRARSRFGPVHLLDPFDATGLPSAAYNPMDTLDPASPDVAEDAATLAEALVLDPPGQVAEAHWNEEAKALLAGIILFVACEEEPSRRTLATVREHITAAPDAFAALLRRMQDSPAAGQLVARAANRHLGKSDREAAGVLSSAQRHTHFLDSPRMAAVMGRSDVRFADLKEGTATVFLVLPPDRLDAYSRWLRLLVSQAVTDMARSRTRPAKPVLFLLDEFAALGHLAPVERAMGLMAGYGLQLWPILQDLHQLRATYGRRAGTFFSNAGVIQTFGVNDYETAEWLSKTIGQETVEYETESVNRSTGSRSIGRSQHFHGRNLLNPDEIMRIPPDMQILLIKDMHPLAARKLRYYADGEFKGMFDPA
ncbi:type IV secretory system conjugative DNA transfer family protein [Afifella sp. H1R]